MIGAVYDDCVGAGDVYTVLNDGRGHQHIVFVLNEIEHYPLHLFFIHLPMADSQTRLRYEAFDERGNRFDGFNAIVYEENLTTTTEFKFNRRLDNVL